MQGLENGDAGDVDDRRKLRLRLRDAELREDLIDVGVGLDVEVDVERGLAVVGVDGLHVDHVVDAVHLLFERRGDGLLECFGVGAGVGGLDLDLGRNDVGVLRDGQAQHRHEADDDGEDRDDDGDDRPPDEEV